MSKNKGTRLRSALITQEMVRMMEQGARYIDCARRFRLDKSRARKRILRWIKDSDFEVSH